MAFITLSGLVSDIKGKLGGSYFQAKKGGVTINTINSNNKSKGSTAVGVTNAKARLAYVAKSWRMLTPTEQATWQAGASVLTRINKNGNTYVPTGYQIYCEQNLNLVNYGYAPITVYSAASYAVDMSQVAITTWGTGGWLYTNTMGAPATVGFRVFATAPQSKGTRYPRSQYRFIGEYIGTVGTTAIDNLYEAVFGRYNTDDTAFFKIVAVELTSGIEDGSKLTKADAG